MKTTIYEYNGKKILNIDDMYYNNISIFTIKILEKILKTGIITDSLLTDYNSISNINDAKNN